MLQRITPEICLCATAWSSDMSWCSLSEMACHERSMRVALRKQRGLVSDCLCGMTSGGHECIPDHAAICTLDVFIVLRCLSGRKVPENGRSCLPDYLGLIEGRWLRMTMFEWGNVLERTSPAYRSGRLISCGYWLLGYWNISAMIERRIVALCRTAGWLVVPVPLVLRQLP